MATFTASLRTSRSAFHNEWKAIGMSPFCAATPSTQICAIRRSVSNVATLHPRALASFKKSPLVP